MQNNTLRDLAKKVKDISLDEKQDYRRNLWRDHQSFIRRRPPIYIRAVAFYEYFDTSKLTCTDPLLREYEQKLHELIFRDTLNDDYIIEPWIKVNAVYPNQRWGVPVSLGEKPTDTGAAGFKPSLIEETDFDNLVQSDHIIDEAKTKENVEKLQDAIGDIIEIDLDRGPQHRIWSGDISTDIAKLRGLEQIMWDAYDRPEWFHKVLAFMRDGILKTHKQAEDIGDWSLTCNENQAMCYSHELVDMKPNTYNVKRSDIWGYMAAQEYTTFGPMQFNEFMLEYQIPILNYFGLTAYGCCEDLTQKIDLLRKIKNLRRIAVSPFADVEKSAQAIGKDYILSWRPNPATMIATGLNEGYVRNHMRENFEILKRHDSFFDITLKDVETVNKQPENIAKWVQIVREEIDRAEL